MKLDYGKNGLEISLDPSWNVTVFKPEGQLAIENPVEIIREKIKNPIGSPPLNDIIKNKISSQRVCIVVSDATRPVPSHIILEALIKELNEYGIGKAQIDILIATGLHRSTNSNEIERIVGKELARRRIDILGHVAKDKSYLKDLGESSNGSPIYINKHFYECDTKILTGAVEAHFFFGFSGGRKAIAPGIASEETILSNHSAAMIASPYARFGIYKENPMHQHALEIAKKAGVDFIVNVCINENHEITQVAAGDLEKAHENLVDYQLKHVFRDITKPYDIVVCGNGGFPLDLNLYQAVKSMALGEMAVKEGGTIISVNECSEGVGIGQEKFRELIFSGMLPKEIHDKILKKEIVVPDQWEIQILARVLMKADIFLISRLKENEIGKIGLKHAKSVEEAIQQGIEKHGKDAKILILPNGPQVLPLLKE
jgi:nickel-dependent lactate racemase